MIMHSKFLGNEFACSVYEEILLHPLFVDRTGVSAKNVQIYCFIAVHITQVAQPI